MSNRVKLMRMKLPKPTQEKAAEMFANKEDVPLLTRRQLRSMRRRVTVITVLDTIQAHQEKEQNYDH